MVKPIRNLSRWLFTIVFLFAVTSPHAAIYAHDKLWPNGMTLNVWFIDGNPRSHQWVKQAANQWSRYSNLQFSFYHDSPPRETHIRVAFSGYDGSELGNHNDYFGKQPTLRLASLQSKSVSDAIKQRLAIHELGHALGLEHEFLHPQWPYGRRFLDHQAKRCETLLAAENSTQAQTSGHCKQLYLPSDEITTLPFDEESIMMYPIKAEWLDDRYTDITAPLQLSFLDKIAVSMAYPRTTDPNPPVISKPLMTSKSIADGTDDTKDLKIQFVNRCHERLIVRLKSTLSNDYQMPSRIRLKPMEKSIVNVDHSPTLQWKVTSEYGQFNQPENNTYYTFNLRNKPQEAIEIPLYCD